MSQDRPGTQHERILDLLADRALCGLSPPEADELAALLRRFPEFDAEEFDRLAATIDLSLSPRQHEPLPAHLRGKIERTAPGVPRAGETLASSRVAPPAASPLAWMGWLAAAACLLVAATVWWRSATPGVPGGAAQGRQQLLASPGVITTGLDKISPDSPAQGDVVWSPIEQRGYLRLRGLPVNDPRQRQYQLWIFDKNQDERYPIDGGVFDVARDGEVVVPIRGAIRVVDPTMFAITVEKPGGVVVSSREQIVLLGKVATVN